MWYLGRTWCRGNTVVQHFCRSRNERLINRFDKHTSNSFRCRFREYLPLFFDFYFPSWKTAVIKNTDHMRTDQVPSVCKRSERAHHRDRRHRNTLPERCGRILYVATRFQILHQTKRLIWVINPRPLAESIVEHVLSKLFPSRLLHRKHGSGVQGIIEDF